MKSIIEANPAICKTLEIGCAYGISSLFICLSAEGRCNFSHTIIDPFQFSQWKGIGVNNLKLAGVQNYKLVEKKSEFALPELLEKGEGKFDFIFIDGWHTFDHTLVDCFYSTRLLRVGGILVIDDVAYPSVARVVNYLKKYPCYKEIASIATFESKGISIETRSREGSSGFSFKSPNKKILRIVQKLLSKFVFNKRGVGMIALQKIAEDNRNWNWHNEFF